MTSLNLPKRAIRIVATTLVAALLHLGLCLDGARIRAGDSWFQGAAADTGAERRVAVIIVPEAPADEQSALILENFLRQNTSELAGVDLVTAADALGGDRTSEIESLIDRGIGSLNRGDHAGAERTLTSAHQALNEALGAVDRRTHARVLKGLGVARLLTGDVESARDLITRSLLIFEQQSVSDYDYSMDARNLYREVRQGIQDAFPGTLEVSSEPAGAAVYVNHQIRGFTSDAGPVTLQNLPPGPHFVRLVRDGSVVWADYVVIQSNATARVSATLAPSATARRFEAARNDAIDAVRRGTGAVAALGGLRDTLGATEILVALASSTMEGFELRGIFLTSGNVEIPVEEIIIQDAGLVQTLRAVTAMTIGGEYEERETLALDSPTGVARELDVFDYAGSDALFIDPDSPLFAGTRPESVVPVYKKWWFWTIVGVAAAGATTGIVFLSTSQSGTDSGPTGGVNIMLNQF